jgi:hypothetical protein
MDLWISMAIAALAGLTYGFYRVCAALRPKP